MLTDDKIPLGKIYENVYKNISYKVLKAAINDHFTLWFPV